MEVFNKNGSNKNPYAKIFIRKGRYLYIPINNPKIINKSFDLYPISNSFKNIYIKIINFIICKRKKNLICTDFSKSINDLTKSINGYRHAAIYTGTNFINGSYTLQLMDDDSNILGFAKIPKSEEGKIYIDREKENLEYLKNLNLEYVIVPDVIAFDKNESMLIQSTKEILEKDKSELNDIHLNFINELYNKTKIEYVFNESEIYRQITYMRNKYMNYKLGNLLEKALMSIKSCKSLNKIEYCFSHYDFYPSNIKIYNDKLYVFDWESGKMGPILYDIFNYIHTTSKMSSRIQPRKGNLKKLIIKEFLENKKIIEFLRINGINKEIIKPMLIIYFCELIYKHAIELELSIESNITIKRSCKFIEILVD